MDGPSHYREAERLIKAADTVLEDPRNGAMQQLVMLQGAQVHATLALAAATIEPVLLQRQHVTEENRPMGVTAWMEAIQGD